MKKLVSVLICVSILFSFSLTAFAAGGLGTYASPYLISTAEELQAISSDLDSAYRLTNDIDLNGVDFMPIGDASSGAFTGSFDGNGYKISNLSIVSFDKYTGLFGYSDGEIKNLTLENAEIEGRRYTGGIVGYLDINGNISDCSVSGSVTGTCSVISAFTGGVAGYCAGEINDCINEATVSACAGVGNSYSAAGGIVGFCAGRISGCNNNSTVKAFADTDYTYTVAGGIIGILDSKYKINDCVNKGSVFSDVNQFHFYEKSESGVYTYHQYFYISYSGGIIGQSIGSEAVVDECINDGLVKITGERKEKVTNGSGSIQYTTYIGGIIGTSKNLTIQNCENNYMLSSTKFATAGLVGYSSGLTMMECYNDVNFFSEINVAGLVYKCDTASFKNSANYGNISSNSSAAGLIYNANQVEFFNCENYGDISSNSSAAGLIYNANQVEFFNCENYGDISVETIKKSDTSAAGFVCTAQEMIVSECSNYGNIYIENNVRSSETNQNLAGGIAANVSPFDISKTQSIGTIYVEAVNGYPDVFIGGLCGSGRGIISECQILGDIEMYASVAANQYGNSNGYAGGLVGKNGKVEISNCNVFGDVNSMGGYSYSGPLAGESNSSSKGNNNYYKGVINAKGNLDYGRQKSNIFGINYISEDSIIWGEDFSSKLTDAEMKNSEKFKGFDFKKIWISDPNVNSGYPMLRCFYNNFVLSEQFVKLRISESLSLSAFYEGQEQFTEWSSSDKSVATVSEDGLVTPVSSGSVKIFAKDSNGRLAVCIVNVESDASGLFLNDVTLNLGKNTNLSASNIGDENIIKWEISDESVANLEVYGMSGIRITTKSVGTATITATSTRGYTASCTLTVTSYVTGMNLPSSITISRYTSKHFGELYIRPYPTQSTLTWTTTDSNIVSVDENGVVTGISRGTAIIRVESDNGLYDECNVTVNVPVESLTVDKGSITVTKGFTDRVIVTPYPFDTTDTITYSSSNTSVVSVDSTGVVTGLKPGTSTITVTSTSGKKAYCIVTVEDIENPVTGVTLDRKEMNISKGEIVILNPTVLPSNATNKQLVWNVEDSSIATVSQTGVVKGISQGTTTVTVTTTDGGYTAECIINVIVKVSVDTVELNLTEEILNVGETSALEAVISPANATNKNVSWSSSDESIAKIDDNGVVTALSKGNATITVTTEDGEKTAEYVVTVTEPVESVIISQKSATIDVNESVILSATVLPKETKYKDILWSSSNENVAIVDEKGAVTALNTGVSTIIATAHNGVNAVCKIYVVASGEEEDSEFSFLKNDDGVSVVITAYNGTDSDVIIPEAIEGLPVTALGTDLFVNCKQIVKTLAIPESVTEIAENSFDSSVEKVICYENSAAHIYAENKGINYEFVFEFIISPTSVVITRGQKKQLSINITPSSMANNEITWSSSNNAVATVDETGLVNAKKSGNAVITATDKNGNSAKCNVKVNPSTPTIVIYNFNHSYEQKLDLWDRYSDAEMKLGFHSYNCEDAVRFVWSSSNRRVKIDSKGNITNTGFFGRSSTITIKAYDAEGKVIAKNSVKVMFYKFKWQQDRLQSQSIISDNYLNKDVVEDVIENITENESIAIFSYFFEFIEKLFKLFKV